MRRLGLVVAAVAALLSTAFVPPAAANTVEDVTFAGTIAMGPGLAYPCAPGYPDKCPGVSLTPKTGVKGLPVADVTGPNTATARLESTCAYQATHVNKGTYPPQEVGSCTFGANGTVTGACGSWSGTLTGAVRHNNPLFPSYGLYVTVKMTNLGSVVVITGTAIDMRFGRTGNVQGVANVQVLDPAACLTKAAHQASVVGAMTLKVCYPNTNCP